MAGTGPRTTNLPVKSLYVSKAFMSQKPSLKESMRLNLNFQGVGSSNQENYSSGRLQHFPEQHIYTRGGERQCRAKFILYGNKTVHF